MRIGVYESWTLIYFFFYPHLYALTLTSNGSLAGCPVFDPAGERHCSSGWAEQTPIYVSIPLFVFGFENDAPDYWRVHLHSFLFPHSFRYFPPFSSLSSRWTCSFQGKTPDRSVKFIIEHKWTQSHCAKWHLWSKLWRILQLKSKEHFDHTLKNLTICCPARYVGSITASLGPSSVTLHPNESIICFISSHKDSLIFRNENKCAKTLTSSSAHTFSRLCSSRLLPSARWSCQSWPACLSPTESSARLRRTHTISSSSSALL